MSPSFHPPAHDWTDGRMLPEPFQFSLRPLSKPGGQQGDSAAGDAALGEPGAAFPGPPDTTSQMASVQPPDITRFPEAEVPDLFTINRRFHWGTPHGQWMNQMLKEIAAAKAAGDTDAYEALTARYTAWADKYLRR